jgi:hypothetical protein
VALDNMPDFGPMLLPGAAAYGEARAARERRRLAGQHIAPQADHFAAHLDCLPAESAWNRALQGFVQVDA